MYREMQFESKMSVNVQIHFIGIFELVYIAQVKENSLEIKKKMLTINMKPLKLQVYFQDVRLLILAAFLIYTHLKMPF